jgi:hypothetical protein
MLFKSGPMVSDADALERGIRKKMYLALVDAIGEASPAAKQLNKDGKRLLDINAVASDAASRTTNRNKPGSMTDLFIGSTTAISTAMSLIGGKGELAPGMIAVGSTFWGAKKLMEQGRGANFLINIGRRLEGKKVGTGIAGDIEQSARTVGPESLPDILNKIPDAPKVDASQENPFWDLEKATKANSPEAIARAEAELNAAAGMGDETFNPPPFEQALDEGEAAAYAANYGAPAAKNVYVETGGGLRKQFFPNYRGEIKKHSLPASVLKEISKSAEKINTMHDTDYSQWLAMYGERGFPDKSDFGVDDVVQLVNETTGGGKGGKGGILGSQRGAVGTNIYSAGVSPAIGLTSAIKDPLTGKIYKGDWRGHKGAVSTGEDDAVKTRLQEQFFRDNTTGRSDYVGFLDENGNFITRAMAEGKLARMQKSPFIEWGGERGAVNPANPDIRGMSGTQLLTSMAGGSAAGGAAGATVGDTPEDRQRNMLVGAGLGMVGGVTLAGLSKGIIEAAKRGRFVPAPQAGSAGSSGGAVIARKLGVTFNGDQLGENDLPLFMLFTDPQTKSTFAARDLASAQTRLVDMRGKFGGGGQ